MRGTMKGNAASAVISWACVAFMIAGPYWPNRWLYWPLLMLNLVCALLCTWLAWDHVRQKRARV